MSSKTSHQGQLTLEELQQLKWLLGGVLTLLSVATVFYLDVDAWTLMALTAAAVVAGLIRPDWPARVSRWVHRLAFPFVAAFFSADLWLSGELLPAMVRLDILLLLYRSIIYRRRRDDLQVIVLGLFLLVVAGVLSVALTFAVHILAFAAGALAFLLTITLSAAAGEKSGAAEAGEVPAWARHVSWVRLLRRVRGATNWRVVALGGALFAGLVVMSGLLFLAIPRFQLENSFFLERFISKKARAGFSDTIRFGDVTEITLDESVALSVDVSERSAVPTEPYWRMMVLDEYREGTFRLSAGLRMELGPEQGRMTLPGTMRAGGGEEVFWTFYLESGVSRYLPLLGRFGLLQFTERQNYRYGRALGVLALQNDPVRMTAYRVARMENSVRVPDRGFAEAWRERRRTIGQMLSLNLGEEDVAVLERVVREIAGDVGGGERNASASASGDGGVLERAGLSTEEFLRRGEAWLERRHAYSLQPRIPEGAGDPLVRWLVSEEGGHCELFAGSLVLLARAAGLPARVVTGFRGGSWNGYSNHFTLRNSDAHAWCEVFDRASEAWLRADPTPGSSASARDETSGEATLAQRTDRSWTARLDSLRVFWYRRIVSFDQQTQIDAIRAVKEATENSGKWLRAVLERAAKAVKAWFATPWDGRRAAGGLAALIVLAMIGWVAVRRPWAGWRGSGAGKRRAGDAVRREAGRWLTRWPANGDEMTEGIRRELERLRFGAAASWSAPHVVFEKARRQWRVLRKQRRQAARTAR